jgi:hypothetical protein
MKAVVWRVLIAGIALPACMAGGFNSVQKTAQLRPGMSFDEAVALLGPPRETVIVDGKRVATFWLHQEWRGNVPFDLVFAGQPEALESWSENQEKFAASQAQLGQIAAAMQQSGGGGAGAVAPTGPNDPNLQRQIAGLWWGYSGSTERSIGLCADGTYFDSRESSYSGRGFDSGGNQTMAWGAASQGGGQGRWTISGDTNAGMIHVSYANGSTANIAYRQIGDPGCLSFDGNTLCRKSAACR